MRLKITDIATGRTVLHTWFEQLADAWQAIERACSDWYACDAASVHAGESDDGDTIEIDGKPVATVEWIFPRAELRRPLMAAE